MLIIMVMLLILKRINKLILFLMLIFPLISTAGEDPMRKKYLNYIQKNGYEGVMEEMIGVLQKKLPIKSDYVTTTYSITFIGTQLLYRSYMDFSIVEKIYEGNIQKKDFYEGSKYEKLFIQERIDSICRNNAFRLPISMGMHVKSIVIWLDSNTEIFRYDVFNSDCIKAGL